MYDPLNSPGSRLPTPKRARPNLFALLALVLLAVAIYFSLAPREIKPPSVSTAGLDPAVAMVIEGALNNVRANARSGDAWGRLGSALMHYEFIEEARFAFNVADGYSTNDARWPYLHAMLVLPRHPDDAAVLLRKAVALCPKRPDTPRVQLAQLLVERGEADEAEQHFHTLLRLTTNHPLALLGLARLRRAQGRFDESRAFLDRCLNDPHTAKAAHALLAQLLQALGDAPGAEAASRRAASLLADTPWPDPFFTEAAAFRVGRKALLQEANDLLDRNRFDLALRAMAAVTRDYPDDDEAWYLTGWALNQSQRPAEAERALREHLRRSPQSPKGHAQLAVSLLMQERFAEAIQVLEAGLKLKPTWREFHFNLGFACTRVGRDADAVRHLRDALALDPNHVPTYTALGELLLRRGESAEARRLLQQAIELEPSNARARTLLQSAADAR